MFHRLAVNRVPRAFPARNWSPGAVDAPRLLTGILLIGAFGYIGTFAVTAVFRMVYPFPLEATEPPALVEVVRILHGQPVYTAPTLAYVPLIYGPVYFYMSALASLVTGPTLVALRLVSLLASAGSIGVVFRLVQRETGSVRAGLFSAGLLAACNPLAETSMDLGRVDALFTFLILAALYGVRTAFLHGGRRRPVVLFGSGALIVVAAFTKLPIAAAPIGLAVLVGLAFTNRRQAISFALGMLVCLGLFLLLLRILSGPWATWFVWNLPRQHIVTGSLIGRIWLVDLLPHFGVALLLVPVAFLGWFLNGNRCRTLLYGLALASMIGVSWASRSGGGGAPNVLLPAFAVIATLSGLGLAEALRQLEGGSVRASVFQGYVLAGCIVQLALLAYDPRALVPYRSDRVADEQLAAALSGLPGPMFAPEFAGYLPVEQGQQPFLGAVDELLGSFGGQQTAEGAGWLQMLAQALQERRFRYVIVDVTDDSFKDVIVADGYALQGPLIPESSDFYAWRTPHTPQADLYVPSETVDEGAQSSLAP